MGVKHVDSWNILTDTAKKARGEERVNPRDSSLECYCTRHLSRLCLPRPAPATSQTAATSQTVSDAQPCSCAALLNVIDIVLKREARRAGPLADKDLAHTRAPVGTTGLERFSRAVV